MSSPNRVVSVFFAIIAAAVLCGCQGGPVAIRASRTQYNQAMQVTASEQLLLNIVRLKYREPIAFLEINAINTSYKFDASGSLNFINPRHPSSDGRQGPLPGIPVGSGNSAFNGAPGISGGSWSIGGNVFYDEDPTFSYAPVQGAEFVKRLVGEIDVKTLLTLLRGGWHVDKVMRITVDRVGDMQNSPEQPSSQKFMELARVWRTLQNRFDLAVAGQPGDEEVVVDSIYKTEVNPNLILSAALENYRFLPRKDDSNYYRMEKLGKDAVVLEARYADSAEAAHAAELLGKEIHPEAMGPGRPIWKMRLMDLKGLPTAATPANDVAVHVRSFKDVLFYLAQGIEVPALDAKKVKDYHVDWRAQTKDLLDVRCSLTPPVNAFVAVLYRGVWFYIDDDDLDSKDTFALLGYIYAIQAGEVIANSPVLTLPVK